jgi:hypothetical protein
VANKVIEKLKGETRAEEEQAEEQPAEDPADVGEGEAEEKRTIDYSSFEERLAKLN